MNAHHRLCLGTAQFGLDYGISNESGQIPATEVQKILQAARDNHVEWLDTAKDYGTSEDVLAQFTEEIEPFHITTKTPKYDPASMKDFSVLEATYKQALDDTLCKLHKSKADIYYLRLPEKILGDHGASFLDFLQDLKSDGLICKIGISVYNKGQIDDILTHFTPDVIQLPFNILDQRLLDDGTLQELKTQGIEIHARSVFLQGLLLMSPEKMRSYFDPIKSHMQKWQDVCHAASISPLQGALSYVYAQKNIDKILIGVSCLKDWQEILEAVSILPELPLDPKEMKLDNETFINPVNWES